MSFENAFEKWLISGGSSNVMEEEGSNMIHDSEEEGAQEFEMEEGGDGADASDEETDTETAMPVIERMAWREEDLKGMPVLQRMVDLPSQPSMQLSRSPPPPPLSLSLRRCPSHGKNSKKSGQDIFQVKSHFQDKFEEEMSKEKYNSDGQKSKDSRSREHRRHKQKKHKKRSRSADRGSICRKSKGVDRLHKSGSDDYLSSQTKIDPATSPGPEGDAGDQVMEKPEDFALCQMSKLHKCGNPSDTKSCDLRRTTVLSPDRANVEPDSTSELSGSDSKSTSQRTSSEVDMDKGTLSPSASGSSGCVHSGGSGEVSVRVEDGVAECDSTSMFLTSPSAISPASQGEIEERVCPVLTDHEDGSHHVSRWSPGHCVCQCRTFLPPVDPITSTPPSMKEGDVGVTRSGSTTKSDTSLVADRSGSYCESAPCLEKMPGPEDQSAVGPAHESEERMDSPPLLRITHFSSDEQEKPTRKGLGSCDAHNDQDSTCDSEHHEMPPPLTRYETCEKDQGSSDLPSPPATESPPVLTSLIEQTHRTLSARGESRSREKVVREKDHDRKEKISEFSPDIKWESAVATVETKPSPKRGNGDDGKPTIVIKIRTKAAPTTLLSVPEVAEPVAPSRQSRLRPKTISKKRHTIDSPENARNLRKRRITGEVDSETVDSQSSKLPSTQSSGGQFGAKRAKEEYVQDVEHSEGSQLQGKKSKLGKTDSCQLNLHASPKQKRRRRNTVSLGDGLSASVAHLPPDERDFVLSTSKLSRLQTRTHTLVSTLFPRLASHLAKVAPESQRFEEIIDDIIGSLQRSEVEETNKDSEELSCLLENLTLESCNDCIVPVFSPAVVLCRSPNHSLETFQEKVCTMLQLLLPDLTVSLTNNLFQTSEELEIMIDRVVTANTKRTKSKKTE